MHAPPSSPKRARAPLVPVFIALALVLPFVPLFQMHPDGAFDLLALMLAFTGGIYFGAALRDGARARLVWEGAFGGALVILGALSLWWSPLWMALGFALHGAWDLAHHTGAVAHGVRRWFPPFCAAWDWGIAALVVFFSRG